MQSSGEDIGLAFSALLDTQEMQSEAPAWGVGTHSLKGRLELWKAYLSTARARVATKDDRVDLIAGGGQVAVHANIKYLEVWMSSPLPRGDVFTGAAARIWDGQLGVLRSASALITGPSTSEPPYLHIMLLPTLPVGARMGETLCIWVRQLRIDLHQL